MLKPALEILGKEFDDSQIAHETIGNDVVAIVHSDHYVSRLNEAFGVGAWKREYREVAKGTGSVVVECRIVAFGFKTSWCAGYAEFGQSVRPSGEAYVIARTKSFKAACSEWGLGINLNSTKVEGKPKKLSLVDEVTKGQKTPKKTPDKLKHKEVPEKKEEAASPPEIQPDEPPLPLVDPNDLDFIMPDEPFDPRNVNWEEWDTDGLKEAVKGLPIKLEDELRRRGAQRSGKKILKQIISEFLASGKGERYLSMLEPVDTGEKIEDPFASKEEEEEDNKKGVDKSTKPLLEIDDLSFGARGLPQAILFNDFLAQYGFYKESWDFLQKEKGLGDYEDWDHFCLTCTREDLEKAIQ